MPQKSPKLKYPLKVNHAVFRVAVDIELADDHFKGGHVIAAMEKTGILP
jgi:hypothetical protein